MNCREKLQSSLLTGLFPVWILVLATGACKVQIDYSSITGRHFNEIEAVDKWDSVFCPFYRGLMILFYFFFFF